NLAACFADEGSVSLFEFRTSLFFVFLTNRA
ncbi:MAG: hypothetical protein ACI85F_001229, partial [Bacteroidia bacterium]